MKYTTKNLLATLATEKKGIRETLQCLKLEKGVTIGCDGFQAVWIDAIPSDTDETINALVHNKEIKDFKVSKKNQELSITLSESSGLVELKNEGNARLASNRELEYPNINQVYPNESDYISIGVSSKLLRNILDIIEKVGEQAGNKVVLMVNKEDNTRPIIVKTVKGAEQQARGIVMPMRLD